MNKTKLLRLLPAGWNVRVFTDADFYHLCEREGVRVFESDMPLPGAYCVYDRMPVIFINRRLPPAQKLHVQFHELGHHWLHYPFTQFFLGLSSKLEFEAELVAACALIPLPVLASRSRGEIEDEFGYPPELVAFRFEAWRLWGV